MKLLQVGFWTGDLFVVGLLLAGLAGAYVPPEQAWSFQLIAITVPYLGVTVAVVVLAALATRRWRIAAAHGALGVLALAISGLATGRADGTPVAPDAPGLTVMTFNANPEIAGRKEKEMSQVVAREHPHVIAMQEFGFRLDQELGTTAGPPLVTPLLAERAYTLSWPLGDGRFVLNPRPIFSRLEVARPAEFLTGDPQEGLWKSGGSVRTLYRWQGRTIAIYNVHLHSFGHERPWKEGRRAMVSPSTWRAAIRAYRTDFWVRAEQARMLRRILDTETHPFIVCGDLNSTPSTWVYTHLSRGLQDAFRRAGTGWGATFPARFPLVRIDFILASEDWEVRRAHVSRTVVSDHIPVIAEFALRSPRPESEKGGEGGL